MYSIFALPIKADDNEFSIFCNFRYCWIMNEKGSFWISGVLLAFLWGPAARGAAKEAVTFYQT